MINSVKPLFRSILGGLSTYGGAVVGNAAVYSSTIAVEVAAGFAARNIIVSTVTATAGLAASGIVAGALLGWGLFCLGEHIMADKEDIWVSTKKTFKECLKKARKKLVKQAEEKVREI